MAIFNVEKLLRRGEKRSTALGGMKKFLLSNIIVPLADLSFEAKEGLVNYDATVAAVANKDSRRYEANANSLYNMEKENRKIEIKIISTQAKVDDLVEEIDTATTSVTPKQLRKAKSKLLDKRILLLELEDIFDRTAARIDKLSKALEKADLSF